MWSLLQLKYQYLGAMLYVVDELAIILVDAQNFLLDFIEPPSTSTQLAH